MNLVDMVLTARLAEFCDPWRTLGLRRGCGDGLREAHEFVPYEKRTGRYHYARIRHFMAAVRGGWPIDPVVVDCHTVRMRVLPCPVIIDGHHRLAAFILAGAERMPISFSGRVDLLRYLEGRRKTAPED